MTYVLIGVPGSAAYYEALGRFVHVFAKVEMAMAFTLWRYAKTQRKIARAIFSGVRVESAMSLIKRLTEVADISANDRQELEYVFTQLGIINRARNDLIHYGAEGSNVTNRLKALTDEPIRSFPISPTILDDMSADLNKIIFHLHRNHMGRHTLLPNRTLETLRAAWQYIPPSPPKSQGKK